MRIVRAFLVVAGLVWLGPTPAAAADCSGPMVTLGSTVVDRGQLFVVIGRGMGDNCYDTGPPPDGEGGLGRPLDDLEVVVSQGGLDTVVAEGAASEDYSFWVQVVVPGTLQPGPATVELRRNGRALWSSSTGWGPVPLRVSEEPPGSVPAGVATIGWQGGVGSGSQPATSVPSPKGASPTSGASVASGAEADSPLVPGLVGGAVGAVVALAVALGVRRRGATKMG